MTKSVNYFIALMKGAYRFIQKGKFISHYRNLTSLFIVFQPFVKNGALQYNAI